jgi:peptide/nickel transport system substrate-binding protein
LRTRWLFRAITVAAVASIVGAACSSSSSSTPQGSSSSSAPAATTAAPKTGGNIVVGAEQWPDCINPITTCSSATWYWYSVGEQVLPYAMVLNLQGNFEASPLLVEAPTLDNGGITQSPFTITYKINPDAEWSDGTPITSKDFDFTWKAIMNTTGAYTTTGYDQITSIDTSDPKTAVIHFKSVYVDWPDLFGGVYQGLFEAHAFPQFENSAKPNLKSEMLDNMPFSGGPWILKSWTKDQAVLVRNDHYFGKKALLDQVTIVPRTDQSTEIQSLLSGEVAAIYPQPSDVSLLDQVSSNSAVKAEGTNGAYYEALWLNQASAPLDDPKVREAFMYAVDRQAVIDAIIKLNNPSAAVLNCGIISFPNIGPWCQQQVFQQFTYDPNKAKQILTSDGYDCSSTPCTKGGQKLTVQYSTVSTNTRRTTTQELLQPKALAAGFQFQIKNYDAGTLFGDVGPKGKFTVADFAQGGSVDPSITGTLGCKAIPTAANQYAGGNWTRWCNQQADSLMKQSDQELDQTKRLALFNQIYPLETQDFVSLPLYVLPNVGAWRTDKVAGPVASYIPSNLGMFYNMNEWYLAS